jgi:GTPase Era involved in 16S rRNA processing
MVEWNAKGIIIGHKGAALKEVDARADLEKFFENKFISSCMWVNKMEQREHVKTFWLQPIANGLVILSVWFKINGN